MEMTETTLILINVFFLGGVTLLVYFLTHGGKDSNKKPKHK